MKEPVIFLVDDDEDDIYLAQLTFSTHFPEWTLITFDDGQALIDYLAKHPDKPLPIMVLLDLNMPRLTGFETLMILKRHPRWKTMPVAMLTTSSNIDDQTRSKAMGAYTYMIKPASVDQLASLITTGWEACNVD